MMLRTFHPIAMSTFVLLASLAPGCGSAPEPDSPDADAAAPAGEADTAGASTAEEMPDSLTAEASLDDIVEHMLAARAQGLSTRALERHFPDMDRERAYEVQLEQLARQEARRSRVGWKIGWSRVVDPRTPVDPVFGYVLESDVFDDGDSIGADRFVAGSTGVEAEVVFWVDRDLEGPVITREALVDAIDRFAPAIEFVSSRVPSPHPRAHAVADNVYHAGVVLGETRRDLSSVDFATEEARVEIDGETVAQGMTRNIMGRDPIEALLWIANELPKYGRHLEAGDFVVTGTVLTPPPASAGQRARVVFSTLGEVEFEMTP